VIFQDLTPSLPVFLTPNLPEAIFADPWKILKEIPV
jgi:hypothetical protein